MQYAQSGGVLVLVFWSIEKARARRGLPVLQSFLLHIGLNIFLLRSAQLQLAFLAQLAELIVEMVKSCLSVSVYMC